MDEFMRRANEYFQEFEGRHLYPRALSVYWLAWMVATGAFGFCAAVELRGAPRYWLAPLLVTEIAFLVACFAIGAYKERSVRVGQPQGRRERLAFLDRRRRASLERICGVDASKFGAVAKECADLIKMRKDFRVASDASFGDFLRSVYDPESKARIVALLLALTALFVTLLNHSVAPEDANILDALASGEVARWLNRIGALAIGLFVVSIGMRALGVQLAEVSGSLWAIVFHQSNGSRRALNYFVRDLIRLHALKGSSHPSGDSSLTDLLPTNVTPIRAEADVAEPADAREA